jgi:hypothetical protein
VLLAVLCCCCELLGVITWTLTGCRSLALAVGLLLLPLLPRMLLLPP